MDTNTLLSADLLDILFDNRNKAYGAYELRRSYSQRITKSLIVTGAFVSLVFTGIAFANKLETDEAPKFFIKEGVVLKTIAPDEPKPEPIPEPPRRIEQPPIRTEQFVSRIEIADDKDVVTPPPTQADLQVAVIDVIKREGTDYDQVVALDVLDGNKDIFEIKKPVEPEIRSSVDIDAKFDGNWVKFLERNLNGQVAVENDAPPGTYTVLLQFVVDIDGSVSDIKVLKSPGFGLDQEAIRVIRKSKKWEPAMYDGRPVKAYRRQPITFLVSENY